MQVHFQEQVHEHRGRAISQQGAAGRYELQVDPQERLKGHGHESSSQQGAAGRHETDGELEGLSQISRSLERGVPASVSSPDLLADTLQQHAAQRKQVGAQRTASEGARMHRSTSWGQAPAVISRMTSWKEAEKDYSAMQVRQLRSWRHSPSDADLGSCQAPSALHAYLLCGKSDVLGQGYKLCCSVSMMACPAWSQARERCWRHICAGGAPELPGQLT